MDTSMSPSTSSSIPGMEINRDRASRERRGRVMVMSAGSRSWKSVLLICVLVVSDS